MKYVITPKTNSFSAFMGKMEQVGFLLLNLESVIKDDSENSSIPEPFHGFINGQDLV
jgi:hypothetical protein